MLCAAHSGCARARPGGGPQRDMENPRRSACHEKGLRYAGIAAVIGVATRISLTASHHLKFCAGQSGR
jgi:hypothetical protein